MATSSHSKKHTSSPKSSPLKTQYLILYNGVSFLLWAILLYRLVLIVPTTGYKNVYGDVGNWARWTQLLGLVDIVHAATGIVRSPLLTTTLQILSRMVVLAIATLLPAIPTFSPVYSSMLLAHSLAEMIRYSFFTLQLSGVTPEWLKWLRYSAFYVLYPVGISSEMVQMYKSIGRGREAVFSGLMEVGMRAKGVDVDMWAKAWDGLMTVLLWVVWPASTVVLFGHMMKQRKKIYGRRKEARKAS